MTEVANRDIPLKRDVFVAKRQGLTSDLPPGKEQWMLVPTSATLIYGQRDAVLVDALLTIEQVHALVDWVAASDKNLTTIYVTMATAITSLASRRCSSAFPMPERSPHPMS
jgi:hypothetical protein